MTPHLNRRDDTVQMRVITCHLNETVQMRGHKIWFWWEIRNIIIKYSLLSTALIYSSLQVLILSCPDNSYEFSWVCLWRKKSICIIDDYTWTLCTIWIIICTITHYACQLQPCLSQSFSMHVFWGELFKGKWVYIQGKQLHHFHFCLPSQWVQLLKGKHLLP